MTTFPVVGLSKPESRLSSVVLPHPEGPTRATNSPRAIASEKSRSTSTASNDLPTASRLSGLSFISPPDARNLCQLHQDTVDDHADDTDHDHACNQQVLGQ